MHVEFGQTDRSHPAHEGRGKPVVMLIHGMWSHPGIWTNFKTFFEAQGYRVVAPALRHHDAPGSEVHPELGGTSIGDYVSDIAEMIGKMEERPFLIGHSMGGLIAHLLAARGLARAVVGLAPAQSAGAFMTDLRPFWVFRRELSRHRFWQLPQLPSFDAMRYGVLNGIPVSEREEFYAQLVPESGRAVCEIAFWFLDRQRTTWINPEAVACPLLFVNGKNDKLTPLRLAERMTEPYDGRLKLEALDGHAHWLPAEPGWERIAERSLFFFEKEAAEMARRMTAGAAALPAGRLVTAG